jgi:hypothetical protein
MIGRSRRIGIRTGFYATIADPHSGGSMRKILCSGAVLTLAVSVGAWNLSAAQHQHHGQSADPKKQDEKAKSSKDAQDKEAQKKDPNRKKPENQPGAVMNAEELAASHAGHHEMEAFEGGGVLPEGWKHRFDLTEMKLEHVRFQNMGTGMHVTTGPPGIFYNPSTTATGTYTVKATFTQLAKGDHREGYGPFIGGADLEAAGQRYTYFLLRQDGKFLIKQREGVNTKGTVDWTAHPSIKMFAADDKNMTNELAIEVGADTVRFLINGTEVASKPRTEIDTDGIVGLRINHNLNLHIEGFGVHPAATSTASR